MSLRLAIALVGFVTVAATWAAEPLKIRPGRWEVVMRLDFGDRQLPAGMALDETTKFDCITKQDLQNFDGFLSPPDASCKVFNYRATGQEISYLMKCDGMTMDFKAAVHSPDSFTAVSTSHGRDLRQPMVMKFSARRVGDACTVESPEVIVD